MPEALILRMLEAVPELGPIYDEHVADYDGLLPYVFMGDVARFVIGGLGNDAMGVGRSECYGPAVRVLMILEDAVGMGDTDLREFVSVAFLESIEYEPDEGGFIRSAMGPKLREELLRRQNP